MSNNQTNSYTKIEDTCNELITHYYHMAITPEYKLSVDTNSVTLNAYWRDEQVYYGTTPTPICSHQINLSLVNTETSINKHVDLFFSKIAKVIADSVAEATTTTFTLQSMNIMQARNRLRNILFGTHKGWRDLLDSPCIKKYTEIKIEWTADLKSAVFSYIPNYNPSNIDPVLVYVKKAPRGQVVLQEPNFALRRMLDPNCPPEVPMYKHWEERTVSFLKKNVGMNNGVLYLPTPSSTCALAYEVREHTNVLLVMDVYKCILNEASSVHEYTIEKTARRFTVKTSSEGQNMLISRDIDPMPWMDYVNNQIDFKRHPCNYPAHPHIVDEAPYTGEHICVCDDDHVLVRISEKSWMPVLGGLKGIHQYGHFLTEDVRLETERYLLMVKLQS